jgi:serine/threonine protein kinase
VSAEETDRGLIGKQLGAYKISGLLGVGGMGEVYRAEDTRLGRTVAVKVLPAELAQDIGPVASLRPGGSCRFGSQSRQCGTHL